MRIFKILLVLVSLSPPNPASAVETWQNQARTAHLLLEENRVADSLAKFDQAINTLNSTKGDAATTIDLQLNKVYILTHIGRLDAARDIMKQVEPLVMRLQNKSLELRFLRRLSRLHDAEKNFVASTQVRARALKLISDLSGYSSSTYVNELHGLIQTALEAKLLEPAIDAAEKLKDSHVTCANQTNKSLLQSWLTDFFDVALPMVQQRVKQGGLEEGERFLKEFGGYSRASSTSTILWIDLFHSASAQHQAVLANRCREEIQAQAEQGSFSSQDAQRIGSAYLEQALSDVYKPKVKKSTETLLASASRLLETVNSKDYLRSNLLYFQCKSLYALALASRGEPAAAGSALDSLNPSPAFVTDIVQIMGIVQARAAIASKYDRAGDKPAAREQFQKLRQLLRNMARLKNRDLEEKKLQMLETATIK